MGLEFSAPEEQARSETFRSRVNGVALFIIGLSAEGGGVVRLVEGHSFEGVVALLAGSLAMAQGVVSLDIDPLSKYIRHHLSDHPDSARSSAARFLEDVEVSGRSSAD